MKTGDGIPGFFSSGPAASAYGYDARHVQSAELLTHNDTESLGNVVSPAIERSTFGVHAGELVRSYSKGQQRRRWTNYNGNPSRIRMKRSLRKNFFTIKYNGHEGCRRSTDARVLNVTTGQSGP